MKKLAVLLFLLLPAACFGADKYSQLLETAENAFVDGDYAKVIELYETLVQIEKVNDPSVYYNLSNAYYRNGQLGKAVVNIEKAFLLKPCDKDIKHNKRFLSIKAGVQEERGLYGFLNGIVNISSLNDFTVITAVFFVIILSLAALYIINKRKIFKTVILCIFPFLILSVVIISVKIKNEIFNITAVSLKDTSVRSGPGINNPEIFNLLQGHKVYVLGENNGWTYISTKSKSEELSGWAESGSIEKING
ncbi:MAG: SH3 domain-containing protein [Endomicrobium sp.]|jgi:tetratricopeptide (TPR) repeat protein|nr:SH3 domain-containing protein [Endomicrobium sp.]